MSTTGEPLCISRCSHGEASRPARWRLRATSKKEAKEATARGEPTMRGKGNKGGGRTRPVLWRLVLGAA
eukprot:6999837-Alexandrium_andersonii.AAC.1